MVKRNYVGAESRQALATADQLIDNAITQANERLKKLKASLTIQRRTRQLVLRGTLPVKPEEKGQLIDLTNRKQQRVPFGVATLENVTQAEKKALEVSTALKIGNFDWSMLVEERPGAPKTMGEIKMEFEADYWQRRKRDRKAENTWEKSYQDIFKKIPDDDLPNEKNLTQWISQTEPDSKPRQDLIRVAKALIRFHDEDLFSKIKWKTRFTCKYVPKERQLPTDEKIEMIFMSMPDEVAWTFGMIATYGLRPQEALQINPEHLRAFVKDERGVFRVDNDTKTGSRDVYPLHDKWVKKFDLQNPKPLQSNAAKLEHRISHLNKLFTKYGLEGGAYVLRHRYAVRAMELKVPVDIAAKWQGHSVEEHTRTYQKYVDKTTHNKVFDSIKKKKSEHDALLERIRELEAENQRLKLENARLKLELSLDTTM